MALEAGSVYTRFGVKIDDAGFDRWQRRLSDARADARQGADAVLRADDSDFRTGIARFRHEMGEARKERASAKLGVVYDRQPFEAARRDHQAYDAALATTTRNARQAARGEEDLGRAHERNRRGITGLLGAAGGAGVLGLAGGFYALERGAQGAVKGYLDHNRTAKQTEQVIKSTGGAANVTAKHVGDLSDALERKTGVDGDVIQSGANMLLTFTNVRNEVGKGNDIFDQATKTVLDMSTALGQDTSSSAVQLGKALNDPIKGVTALQRVGVSFTKDQREQIKGLVEHGKTLDAQRIILRELNKEFGGSAAATASPFKDLTVTLRNLSDTVGRFLLPLLTKGAGAVNNLIKGLESGSGAGGRIRSTFTGIVTTIRDVVEWFTRAGRTLVDFVTHNRDVQRIIGQVRATFAALITFLRGAFADASRIFRDVLPDLKTIGTAALSVFRRIEDVVQPIIRAVLPGLGKAFRGVMEVVRGVIRIIAGLLSGDWSKAWKGAKQVVSGIIDSIEGILGGALGGLKVLGGKLIHAIGAGISGAVGGVLSVARGFVNQIIDVINVLPGVNIGHIGGGGGNRANAGAGGAGLTSSGTGLGGIPAGLGARPFFAGGIVDAPIAIVGEEAPEHPEVIIPSNPRYRDRAVDLWQTAGRMLGIPGFAAGGILRLGGDVLNALTGNTGPIARDTGMSAGSLLKKLPDNPLADPFAGLGTAILDRARDFIKGHAPKLVSTAGDVAAGSVKGTLGRANLLARMFGLRLSSTYRDPAHNRAVGGVENSLHTHGSPGNPGATDLVGAGGAMQQALAYAVGHWHPREALIHDVGSGLHLHLGWFAKGGIRGAGKTSKITDPAELAAMQALWGVARPYYGANAPDTPPPIRQQALFRIGDGGQTDANRHVRIDPHELKWLVSGTGYNRSEAINTLLHEWAHAFQTQRVWDSKRGVIEGGAVGFVRSVGKKIANAYGAKDFRQSEGPSYDFYYHKVRKFLKGDARDWFTGGQFGYGPTRSTNADGAFAKFARGGIRGRRPAHKAPRPILSGADNRGVRRAAARGERGVTSFEGQIADLERRYGQKDREFGLTDEVILVENDDGSVSVDQAAQSHRAGELGALLTIRRRIRDTIQKYRERVERLIEEYRHAIATLESALGAAKGKARSKERGGYRAAIASYRARIGELKGVAHDLGFDLDDNRIDLEELNSELNVVKGSAGHAAPADSTASATSAAGDTTAPDSAAVAAQATQRANDLQADLNAARATLGTFQGPGDIGGGGASAWDAATFAGPMGTQIVGPGTRGIANPALGAAAGVGITFVIQSLVPPSGQQARELAGAVTTALSGQPYSQAKAAKVG